MLEEQDFRDLTSFVQQHWASEYLERRPVLLGGSELYSLLGHLPVQARANDQIASDLKQLGRLEDSYGRPAVAGLLEAFARTPGQPQVVTQLRRWIRKTLERPIDEQIDHVARLLDQARRTHSKEEGPLVQKLLALKRERRARGVEAGDCLSDRYELERPLGEGGFATVWLAWDRRNHNRVAVKVLHAQHGRDKSRVERFRRGARILTRLNHPNIVRVLDAEGLDDNQHYFVQTLLEGGDLHRQASSLQPHDIWRLLAPVARALGYAHRQKIVHRDIKPANILLDEEGKPWLTDFDLVIMPDTTGGTRTGVTMGTFGFQAPEAMLNAATVGPEADVYGLGMTALFLLSGGTLRADRLLDPAARRMKCEEIAGSRAVQQLLLRALEEEPDRRFRDGDALAGAMERLANGETEPSVRPALVRVEAGSMELKDATGWGQPNVAEALLVAETPITQGQFAALMGYNPSLFQGDPDRPVEQVTAADAARYCDRLSEVEGLTPYYAEKEPWRRSGNGYRLPKELEWVYLAMGGRRGSLEPPEPDMAAWWSGNSNGETRPVGQKSTNVFGLRDMFGNVAEWVEFPDHRGALGGHYASPLEHLHVLWGGDRSGEAAPTTGFRVVRRAPTPVEAIPCEPDLDTYLLWYRRGRGYETVWLGVDDKRARLRVIAQRDGLLVLGGERVLLLEERDAWAPQDLQIGANRYQTLAVHGRDWLLVDAETADEMEIHSIRASVGWSIGADLRVTGLLGPLLFVVSEVHSAGATDFWAASFKVIDLSMNELVNVADRLAGFEPPTMDLGPVIDALDRFTSGPPSNEDEFWMDPVAVEPRFARTGELTLAWQYTMNVSGAQSDGKWTKYTRSLFVEHDQLPPILEPWAQAPSVVRAYLGHRSDGFLGWGIVAPIADDHLAFLAFLEEVFRRSGRH